MTVGEFLNKVYEQECLLKATERQMDQAREELMTIKGQRYDRPRVSGSKRSDLSDTVIKLEKYQDRVNNEWDKLIDLRAQAAALLQELPDKLRAIMIERYINHKSWDQVAAVHHYGWRHVLKLNNHAIDILERKNPNGIKDGI
jgi:DNA-directed RNA polymerase specialized sigma subunit